MSTRRSFSHLRFGVGAAACLVALLFATRRSAATELHYEGPQDCPTREELEFRVTRALDRPLSATPSARVSVQVSGSAPNYQAVLSVHIDTADPPSERSLKAKSCSQLFDALSVAIVLALGEIEREAQTDDGVEPKDFARSSPALEAPATVPLDPGTSNDDELTRDTDSAASMAGADPQVRPGVSLWLMGDLGSLPSLAPGVGLGVGFGTPRWRLRLVGAAWLGQHVDLESPVAIRPGADLNLYWVSVLGCYVPGSARWGSLTLAACASWEMGQLSGHGTRLREPLDGEALWLAPGLALEARWELASSLHASLQLGAVLPLNQNGFVLGTLGSVHQPSNLVGRSGLGVGWDF